MDLQLTGQRAFVSGSTRGIGYAIASALLVEGAEVVVNGRTAASTDRAVDALRAERPGSAVSGIAADLGDSAETEALVRELGEVDILVNNVGVFEQHDFATTEDDVWHRLLDVNLLSAVRLARALLPPMLERGRGRVVMVSSESGVDVPAEMIPYGVTKAATLALGAGLAKLTRGTAVTVNTILGGPTWSDGVADVVESIAEAQGMPVDELRAVLVAGRPASLLGRFIAPREIAAPAVYLASPLSSATNGAALRADGGVLPTIL